jgi:polar amino acid transport system ATP-binding protein
LKGGFALKLELEGIHREINGQTILDNVSLKTSDVRALVLIGPSGGGKSSLLRILAGLDVPDSGILKINDVGLGFNESSLFQHRLNVGTVFQSLNLFPHLSGLENVLLPLTKVHGLNAQEARDRAETYLERFQLSSHAHKKPAQLSGGQRQRIAIVRAMATQPKLLLLDEPTSALDPEMTAEVLRLIDELKQEGKDFVLVTHEISFAKRVADEVAFIAEGKVIDHGNTSKFFNQPAPEVNAFLQKILI